MESVIYEGTKPIGTFELNEEGLYQRILCKMKANGLRRIYAVHGLHSQYLGIPDASGQLSVRIAKKSFNGMELAIASPQERSEWNPWRGEVDGVPVEFCYIKHDENGISLALPEDEAVKFPAWTEQMYREKINGTDTAIVLLDPNGHLPLIERENGGTEYETNDGNALDPLLLADLPADYDYGCGGEDEQQEADRNHL